MNPSASDLEHDILKYLLNNPEGKDTLQGIARFWILGNKIDEIVEDLQSAIRDLVSRGYLTEKIIPTTGHPPEHLYELNSSRIMEIAGIVNRERHLEKSKHIDDREA